MRWSSRPRALTAHHRRLVALVIAALAAGCGQEIDSTPDARTRPASSGTPDTVRAARSTGGVSGPARPQALGPDTLRAATSDGNEADYFRTHLYAERDADVFSMLDEPEEATLVRALHAELGDHVQAGQLLAELEDAKPALKLQAAEARADEAEAKVARARDLLAREFATRADYTTLRNAQKEADAELKQARVELNQTRVRAPFAGVVARRYVRAGERVKSSSPLFRITATAPLRARLLVPERRAASLGVGAGVLVSGVDGRQVRGKVVLVGPTVDPGSGTREVIVELAETRGLLPGAQVTVDPETSGGARL